MYNISEMICGLVFASSDMLIIFKPYDCG